MSLGNKEIMGNNILKYLELSGKSRKEVANAIGVPYSTFTDWCNRRAYPRIDKIEKMANYFHVEKSDLIEGIGHRKLIDATILFRDIIREKGENFEEIEKATGIAIEKLEKYYIGSEKLLIEEAKKLAVYFEVDIDFLNRYDYVVKNDKSKNNLQASLRFMDVRDKWNKEIGYADFSDSEIDELINYAKYIIGKRKRSKTPEAI